MPYGGHGAAAKSIREQIASAVNLIVQIGRMSDGSRKIKSIAEVAGMQGDVITLSEVFRFKEEGFDKKGKIIGQFQASGIIPSFIEKFEQRGIQIPRSLFTTKSSEAMKKPPLKPGAMRLRPAARPAAAAAPAGAAGAPPPSQAVLKSPAGGPQPPPARPKPLQGPSARPLKIRRIVKNVKKAAS